MAALNITLIDGLYDISSVFEGNRYYLPSKTINNTILVKPVDTLLTLTAQNIFVGGEEVIIAKINATEGVVLFTINGATQYVDVIDGMAILRLNNLAEGTYTVTAKYDKFKGYLESENTTSFSVFKVDKYTFDVSANDINVGENAVIDVVLPEDATSDVVAIVNGVNYTGKANNGGAKIIISDLSKGNYEVNVIYMGDDKYTSTNMTTTLNIDRTSVNLTVVDLVKYFHGSDRLVAILLDGNGNPIANMDVTFVVNGVKYRLNINLLPGTYIITNYDLVTGEENSNNVTVKSLFVNDHDL
ncbi:hypothetical protein [uncultured Methanobrevibacter sp.]|uniref:hypothetical protein n=1 Tax=uncultured Methanobrevibacter sp. TaxID=253161 RepID=UPI00260B8D9B|nr:hypothetical protein [uncultured Methanobrevibacter sp.]